MRTSRAIDYESGSVHAAVDEHRNVGPSILTRSIAVTLLSSKAHRVCACFRLRGMHTHPETDGAVLNDETLGRRQLQPLCSNAVDRRIRLLFRHVITCHEDVQFLQGQRRVGLELMEGSDTFVRTSYSGTYSCQSGSPFCCCS